MMDWTNSAALARPQRGPHGHLPLPFDRTPQHKIAHIHAGHQ